jgi:alpha-ketoglutarate-dependent taurine dioxygenase
MGAEPLDARIHRIGTVADLSELDSVATIATVRDRGIVHATLRNAPLMNEFNTFLSSHIEAVENPFLATSSIDSAVSILQRPPDRTNSFIYGGAWHQNLTFLPKPPDMTILFADSIADDRNFTAFIDLSETAPWLSAPATQLLHSVRGIHSTRAPESPQNIYEPGLVKQNLPFNGEIASAHPAFIVDNRTTREWPFLMSNYVIGLDGWHDWESLPLVESLYRFVQFDEFVIRHYWTSRDILMWDNRRYLHRATVSHFAGSRRMWRIDCCAGWGLTAA